jgi:hypothetical protein
MVNRRNRPGEHWWPDLTHTQSNQEVDLLSLGADEAGKGEGVLTTDPSRWQQDVLKARCVSPARDLTAVGKVRSEATVRNTKKFIVIAAKRSEPSDLAAAVICPNCRCCHGAPLSVRSIHYDIETNLQQSLHAI